MVLLVLEGTYLVLQLTGCLNSFHIVATLHAHVKNYHRGVVHATSVANEFAKSSLRIATLSCVHTQLYPRLTSTHTQDALLVEISLSSHYVSHWLADTRLSVVGPIYSIVGSIEKVIIVYLLHTGATFLMLPLPSCLVPHFLALPSLQEGTFI
jgi:hypothetical protein